MVDDTAALLSLPMRTLLDQLASAAPAPGGGAAAALAGAMGAALVQMTANLTLARPKLVDVHSAANGIEARAGEQRQRLQVLAAADATAYARVSAAYRMPKETEAERAARSAAIQMALVDAAGVPLDVVRECARLLVVCEDAAPILNAVVISDVLVGALLAHAALEASAANVEVNVGTFEDAAEAGRLSAELAEARAGARERMERTVAACRARFPTGAP
jgi:methenyltetrahydrofolate cyclohydrolase